MSPRRPDSARARAEAASWFARLGRTAVTTDALRAFRDWRRDPANAAAYARVEATWDRAGALRHDPDILAATADALARRPRRARMRPGRRAAPWLLLSAATALVALAVLATLRFGLLDPAYATGVGEQRTVRLADGSRVHLNTDTRVQVRYAPGRRLVRLTRGQAFFDVARDPARPFVVDAGAAQVRALGTRFDVRRLGDAVRVTLAEGSVRVAPAEAGRAWILEPDQQLTVSADGRAAARPAEADAAVSWTTGRLIFQDTPLAEAAAEVSRYGGPAVTVPDALAAAPVSGVFDTGDTEAFVAAVSLLFRLEARREAGAIRLTRAAG